MSAIGNPDYQRGVASAQLLLAHVPAGTQSVVVGIPPNAETLIVMAPATSGLHPISCTGQTTGMHYTGAGQFTSGEILETNTFFFDVSSAVDQQVTIAFLGGTPGFDWYVYADAAAHLSIDPTKATNLQGVQYVIPTIPDTAADHPPIELQVFGGNAPAAGVIVAAPGAGKRIRLFYAGMINDGGTGAGALTDSIAGTAFVMNSTSQAGFMPYVPQGVPLQPNASLNFTNLFAANSSLVWGGYTVENV